MSIESNDSDNSNDSSSEPTCGVCSDGADFITPCCHERLCEKHEEEFMVTICNDALCVSYEDTECKVCFGLNGHTCEFL
jgi:hypothetical protein